MAFQPPAARPFRNVYSEAAIARTVTGNVAVETPVDALEAVVSVNVTAATGTAPTLTVAFQQQDANGVWYDAGITASITATGTARFAVGPGTANGFPLGGSQRLSWTIGGATPSFTFQTSVQAR